MTAGQHAVSPAGTGQAHRTLACANAVAVAVAMRRTSTLCARCGHRPCRCVSVTPAELAAIRDALSAAATRAERPVVDERDRCRLVQALRDAACWRKLSAYALCHTCHRFPDDAVGLCEHNRADLDAAAAYERLARWLPAFPGWAPASTAGDGTSAGAS
jgi:hypothetical protein